MQTHRDRTNTHHGLSASSVSCEVHILNHLQGVSKLKAGSNTGTNHDKPIPWKDTRYIHECPAAAKRLEAIFRLNLPQRAGVDEILRHVQAFAVIRCILDILVARTGSSEIANLKELLLYKPVIPSL